jgi:CheY-like chemotaxis protein
MMRGERVLVVDDVAENRRLLTCLLELEGATVLQAATGEAAIDMAVTRNPTVILMDISLPGMDGLTAARILREDPRTQHMPVIAVTADDAEHEALTAGCAGYIRKPLNIKTFVSVVTNLVERKRQ